MTTPQNPPVVITKGKVSLADHLNLKNLPLATTPGGTAFCLKALHPSEHSIKAARVPGGNRMSVALCSDAVSTFTLTNANTSVQILQTPNLLVPCCVYTGTDYYNFNNAAFGGSVQANQTYTSLVAFAGTVLPLIQQYRVVSQSVTAELIAPALSDQGTVIAAQYEATPTTAGLIDRQTINGQLRVYVGPDAHVYQPLLPPSNWVLGSQAYTSKAREGVYQPLKLNKFKWVNTQDAVVNFSAANAGPCKLCRVTDPLTFPYYANRTGAPGFTDLDYIPKMSSTGVGVIEFNGNAANVALRVRVRQVVEITCRPGTTYSPLMEVAMPPDATAEKMYYEISARMADGYPAAYNDLGKLKDIILGIGKKVLPYVEPALDVVSTIAPGPIGAIAGAAKAAIPVAKTVSAAIKARKQAKKPAPASSASKK